MVRKLAGTIDYGNLAKRVKATPGYPNDGTVKGSADTQTLELLKKIVSAYNKQNILGMKQNV